MTERRAGEISTNGMHVQLGLNMELEAFADLSGDDMEGEMESSLRSSNRSTSSTAVGIRSA